MRWHLNAWMPVLLLTGVHCLRFPKLTSSLSHGSKLFSSTTAACPTPSAQKPIILLDVDGVINIDMGLQWAQRLWKDAVFAKDVFHQPGEHRWFDVAYSPTVVNKINEWSELADIRWLTSWKHRAPEFLAPRLGLKDFPVLPYKEDPNLDDLWKVGHAQQLANEVGPDRLIIWLDDDLPWFAEFTKMQDGEVRIFNIASQEQLRKYPVLARPNTIYVAPNTGDCLLPEHLDLVDKYLANPELVKGKSIYQYPKDDDEPDTKSWVKVFTSSSPAADAEVGRSV